MPQTRPQNTHDFAATTFPNGKLFTQADEPTPHNASSRTHAPGPRDRDEDAQPGRGSRQKRTTGTTPKADTRNRDQIEWKHSTGAGPTAEALNLGSPRGGSTQTGQAQGRKHSTRPGPRTEALNLSRSTIEALTLGNSRTEALKLGNSTAEARNLGVAQPPLPTPIRSAFAPVSSCQGIFPALTRRNGC